MAVRKKLYSYIRHPFSKNGWPGFIIAVLSCILTQLVLVCSVLNNGDVSMFLAAVCVSSMLLDLCSLLFCLSALREKEKNYAFAVTGAVIALLVLAEWGFVFSR